MEKRRIEILAPAGSYASFNFANSFSAFSSLICAEISSCFKSYISLSFSSMSLSSESPCFFTEVLIGGKVYTLSGFEGEEYLQKVSSYLNHKITECTNSEGYRKQSADTRNVLLALNIADDYFKAKDSIPRCRYARSVTMRPLGVRCINPFFKRYGSYTSSNVPASSEIAAASVSKPTGPPWNFSIIVCKTFY